MLKVINLFGGPGCGKSTTAADVFARMKMEGFEVELILEYAKSRVYEEHSSVFADQAYLFAKQLRQFHRLEGKVEWAVCDSPLLLSVMYAQEYDYRYQTFIPFVYEASSCFNNFNFFLKRPTSYNPNGRLHTEDQARELDKQCEEVLRKSRQSWETVNVGNFVAEQIMCTVRLDAETN
jgi:hypothetical protein